MFPGASRQIHHAFPDPRGVGTEEEVLAEFRVLRDSIEAWANAFARDLLVGDSAARGPA